MKTPQWVAERLTAEKLQPVANRRDSIFASCNHGFRQWRAANDDYLGSGFTRGHMAAAGNHKNDQTDMDLTFRLEANILPQLHQNNAGVWRLLEFLCRCLLAHYKTVHVLSGPLYLPDKFESFVKDHASLQTPHFVRADPPEVGDSLTKFIDNRTRIRNTITYSVLGRNAVAAPTHLFKVVVASVPRLKTNPPVLLGCFVVPNHVLQARFPLAYFKAPMDFIEDRAGLDLSALRRFIHKQHGPSSTHSWTPFDVGVQLEAALSGVSEGSVADKINIAYEKQMCGFQKPTSVSADKENSNKCSRFHLTPPEKLLQAVDMCRHLDLVDFRVYPALALETFVAFWSAHWQQVSSEAEFETFQQKLMKACRDFGMDAATFRERFEKDIFFARKRWTRMLPKKKAAAVIAKLEALDMSLTEGLPPKTDEKALKVCCDPSLLDVSAQYTPSITR
ncbi:MAG: hypothetical protein KVP17_000078 [Porospora cf. gigantea B]|nr:MAG: hypothetical protein KVP17_000078 [Porospora cf. gigantea B]